MKKRISMSAGLVTAGLFLFLTAGIASAVTDCNKATVFNVGTTAFCTSGVNVKLTNISGAACGNWGNGVTQQFCLSETGTDRTLAILLTTESLDKALWVQIGGSADKNDLLNVVTMKDNK